MQKLNKEVIDLQNTINSLSNEILQQRMNQMQRDMDNAAMGAAARRGAYSNALAQLYQDAAAQCPTHSRAPELNELLSDIILREQELSDIMKCANAVCTPEIKERLSPEIVAGFERMSYSEKAEAWGDAFTELLDLQDVRNERIIANTGSCQCDDGWVASSSKSACIRNGSDTPTNFPATTQRGGSLPPDVAADTWYSQTVSDFIDAGFVSNKELFRPDALATRAEFIRLIVDMNGGVLSSPPAKASFWDVPVGSPEFAYMEEAAKEGWIAGKGNCYGKDLCSAQPYIPISRAEATAIIIRSFALEGGEAPTFEDIPDGAWYADAIRTAASRCILQGDGGRRLVRPAANMNRAEMIVMLDRVDRGLSYPNCL